MANVYYYADRLKFDNEKVVSWINVSRVRLLDTHSLISSNLVYLYIIDDSVLDTKLYNRYSDYMIDPTGKFLVPSSTAGEVNFFGMEVDVDNLDLLIKESKMESVLLNDKLTSQVRRIHRLKTQLNVSKDWDISYQVEGNNQYQIVNSSKIDVAKLLKILEIYDQIQVYDITLEGDDYDSKVELLAALQATLGPSYAVIYK